MKQRQGSLLSAGIFLAGNTIGVGFLAIPVLTGPAGFIPGIMTSIFVWLYLICTGLLYLEATLASPNGANLTTMCRNLIGPLGMWIGITTFVIFNYYYLSIFYEASIRLFSTYLPSHFNFGLPGWIAPTGITLIIGGTVYFGTYFADKLNFLLFAGFIIAFLLTMIFGVTEIEFKNLMTKEWYYIFFAIPIFINAFNYQNILPTMATYLKRDVRKLISMIFLGMGITLAVYVLWHFLTLDSAHSDLLWEAFEVDKPIFEGLHLLSETSSFQLAFHFSIFFSATTSLITTGNAVVDFIADTFKVAEENRVGFIRLLCCLGTFLPALAINYLLSPIFFKLSAYLIGWSEIIFTGVIPIWLVTKARYFYYLPNQMLLPGGKKMLVALTMVTFLVVYLEGIEIIRED